MTRDEGVVEATGDLAALLPLDTEVLDKARRLDKPRDFEDRLHLATMQIYGIDTILSNDADFDDAGAQRIAPRRRGVTPASA